MSAIAYFINLLGRKVAVTPSTPLPVSGDVQLKFLPSADLATPTDAQDFRAYSSVALTVLTAPNTAYSLQWSPDGQNWPVGGVSNVTGVDLNFFPLTTVAPGYTGTIFIQGGGFVRLFGGSGGQFKVGAR